MKVNSLHRITATLPTIDNYYYRQVHQPLNKIGKKVLPGIVKYKQSIFDVYEFSDKQRILLQKIPEQLGVTGRYFHAPKYLPNFEDVLLLLDRNIIKSYSSGFELDASSFNYFQDLAEYALLDSKYTVYFAFNNEKLYYKVPYFEFKQLWKYYSRGSIKATNIMTVICKKGKNNSIFDESIWTQTFEAIKYKTKSGSKSKSYIELSIFKAIDCNNLQKSSYEEYANAYSNKLVRYQHYDHIDSIKFASLDSFLTLLIRKQYKIVPKLKKTAEQYYLSHILGTQANYAQHYAKTYSKDGRHYTLNWFIMPDKSILRFLYKRYV